jgi:hypothetical protein
LPVEQPVAPAVASGSANGVERAARLEGADGLHALEPEQEIRAHARVHEGPGGHLGRIGLAGDRARGSTDIGQCDSHPPPAQAHAPEKA